jgi:hypothetical protein
MKASVYTRPGKPLSVPVKRRADFDAIEKAAPIEIVAVDKATECHVTPNDVAARMVEYLGPVGDYLTLEPSAGTGQLARALLASGHSKHELTLVERHIGLAGRLHSIGPTINRCFLEWAAEVRGRVSYPRIIMNPPFSDVRKHIAAALALLGRAGHDEPATLVALVPVTFQHPEAVELETLPDSTFATARVRTKIIRIQR